MSTTTNLSTLKINYLTQAQYDAAAAGGTINQNELYFTPDSGGGGGGGEGTVTSVQVQATSPVQSSTSTAQSTSLNTTISLIDAYGDTKNPYGNKTANYILAGPSSGSAAAPAFRALVAADIPSHASSDTTYGGATQSNYGHAKVINNLTTSSHTAGNALSAYQGYLLQTNKLNKISGVGQDNALRAPKLSFRVGTNTTDVTTFDPNSNYPNAVIRESTNTGTSSDQKKLLLVLNTDSSTQNTLALIDPSNSAGRFLPSLIPHIGTVQTSYTLAANSYASFTVNGSKTGYAPVGIVGFSQSGTGSTVCVPYGYYLASTGTITYNMRNVSTGTAASPTITFRVLYFPNNWFGSTVPTA